MVGQGSQEDDSRDEIGPFWNWSFFEEEKDEATDQDHEERYANNETGRWPMLNSENDANAKECDRCIQDDPMLKPSLNRLIIKLIEDIVGVVIHASKNKIWSIDWCKYICARF